VPLLSASRCHSREHVPLLSGLRVGIAVAIDRWQVAPLDDTWPPWMTRAPPLDDTWQVVEDECEEQWTAHVHPQSGQTYYHNAATGKSTYDVPQALS
jgi:hypothetical protein